MSEQVYRVMHILSLLLLTGFAFSAFAAPTAERRRRSAMITGILSLLVLVGGFGLKAKLPELREVWPGWLFVKLGCWLAVTILAGMVFRRPGLSGIFQLLTIALISVAVWMVFYRPF